MTSNDPITELHEEFSSDGATPTAWAVAVAQLEKAEVFWLSTVRPDGRPHVTPLVAVWLEGALYFITGPGERKARNLAHNTAVVIMTGCNDLSEGLDLVIEGNAGMVRDQGKLRRVAAGYGSKYAGTPFQFTVRDDAFYGEGGEAQVYEVAPVRAFRYARGETFSATRWRFRQIVEEQSS
jgi:hypothetical protein